MRPNTKENSENKQKCQYNDETIISQAVWPTIWPTLKSLMKLKAYRNASYSIRQLFHNLIKK